HPTHSPPSLHDALPIFLEATRTIATIVPAGALRPGVDYRIQVVGGADGVRDENGVTMDATFEQLYGFAVEANGVERPEIESVAQDRKSTRLNSSHVSIS